MTVHTSQGQRCPGELHGLEVHQGPRGARALQGRLVHGALRGGAVEHGHHLQGQPVHDVDTAIVESQGQAWGQETSEHKDINKTSDSTPLSQFLYVKLKVFVFCIVVKKIYFMLKFLK